MEGVHWVAVHWAVHLQQEAQRLARHGAGQLLLGGQVDGVQPSLRQGDRHSVSIEVASGHTLQVLLWLLGCR